MMWKWLAPAPYELWDLTFFPEFIRRLDIFPLLILNQATDPADEEGVNNLNCSVSLLQIESWAQLPQQVFLSASIFTKIVAATGFCRTDVSQNNRRHDFLQLLDGAKHEGRDTCADEERETCAGEGKDTYADEGREMCMDATREG